jgi:hypothetical protein
MCHSGWIIHALPIITIAEDAPNAHSNCGSCAHSEFTGIWASSGSSVLEHSGVEIHDYSTCYLSATQFFHGFRHLGKREDFGDGFE